MLVFDRMQVRRQRARAVATLGQADFLFREVGERLADRLLDIRRTFPVALELGARAGALHEGQAGIEYLVRADHVPGHGVQVVADEEILPFGEGSLDLVFAPAGLHTVNDLPGALAQIARALKPDGLFLAAMFGGETLSELRDCLLAAELEIEGGGSPRVSPFAGLQDAAGLLQRAGFALPVADSETITVTYADPFALMRDLRHMGEANAVHLRRRTPTRRATLFRAAELYLERYAGPDGRVPATFQVMTLTGWRPHISQQKALRPGSAKSRLADALGVPEIPAGEKAGR